MSAIPAGGSFFKALLANRTANPTTPAPTPPIGEVVHSSNPATDALATQINALVAKGIEDAALAIQKKAHTFTAEAVKHQKLLELEEKRLSSTRSEIARALRDAERTDPERVAAIEAENARATRAILELQADKEWLESCIDPLALSSSTAFAEKFWKDARNFVEPQLEFVADSLDHIAKGGGQLTESQVTMMGRRYHEGLLTLANWIDSFGYYIEERKALEATK